MKELTGKKILVTGGAGFIGSHIVDALVALGCKPAVLDNLRTGSRENIAQHIEKNEVTFIQGDITNAETCMRHTEGVDIVLHQAAIGSVPRSIEDPQTTHATNVDGFLNVLEACRRNKVGRVVYASSSSVYGDDLSLPKTEDKTGTPLSPYAVSKKSNELYADVFAKLYGMEIVGLRYFNVFGPRQNPTGPYAAVIPIFIDRLMKGQKCTIYGDGTNRRDFTFVENVVTANLQAARASLSAPFHDVFNIAYGSTRTVKELFDIIAAGTKKMDAPLYGEPRRGEIRDSFADISKARQKLGYDPQTAIEEGIKRTISWFTKG